MGDKSAMDAVAQSGLRPAGPSFAELFTPKLVTNLRAGYGWRQLQTDAIAGLRKPHVRYASTARDAVEHWRVAAAGGGEGN
jgi:hypothetical protein